MSLPTREPDYSPHGTWIHGPYSGCCWFEEMKMAWSSTHTELRTIDLKYENGVLYREGMATPRRHNQPWFPASTATQLAYKEWLQWRQDVANKILTGDET